MQRRCLPWGFFLLICLTCCAVTDLSKDQAKSLELNEIKALLGKYESAWNQHDQQGLLALLHDEFVIFAGSGRRIVYTMPIRLTQNRRILRDSYAFSRLRKRPCRSAIPPWWQSSAHYRKLPLARIVG